LWAVETANPLLQAADALLQAVDFILLPVHLILQPVHALLQIAMRRLRTGSGLRAWNEQALAGEDQEALQAVRRDDGRRSRVEAGGDRIERIAGLYGIRKQSQSPRG
jgi:hypothetical protein